MDTSISIKDDLKDTFLAASVSEANLLLTIYKKSIGRFSLNNLFTNELFNEVLVELHNEKKINIIELFKSLSNNSDISFFSMRGILEELLPQLEAPVLDVMECVLHLIKEAKNDLAAKSPLTSFQNFCSISSYRVNEALMLINISGDKFTDFLFPTLVAGSYLEMDDCFDKVFSMIDDEDIEVRRIAVCSIGQLRYPEGSNLINTAFLCIESVIRKEVDENLLGNILRATIELYKFDDSMVDRVINLIDKIMENKAEFPLQIAASTISQNCIKFPEILLDTFLKHFLQTQITNENLIHNLDYAISVIFKDIDQAKGIDFLEKILIINSSHFSLSSLRSTIQEIFNDKDLFSLILLKWFLEGNVILCEGISSIIDIVGNNEVSISVQASKLELDDSDQLFFIARKAIGYLFVHPIAAASIICCLIKEASDKTTVQKLSSLLFNPLLINYSGELSDYLKKHLDSENSQVKLAAQSSLKELDEYFNILESTGDIPELYPSQSQREAERRRTYRMMSIAMKGAEKKSVFLSILPKSVMLYGNKIIYYAHQQDGSSNRCETPLHKFSNKVEIPRLAHVDPFGLDYMLRIFRFEKMINHEIDN
jgi:hypothetical protein